MTASWKIIERYRETFEELGVEVALVWRTSLADYVGADAPWIEQRTGPAS